MDNLNINILDCTFRDGGYYNAWDFEEPLVKKYLVSMSKAGINVIELGFRNFPKDKFLGAFAYTTDKYIDSLDIDKNIFVGVMIDIGEILKSRFSINKAIQALFQSKDKSRVDLVRIATHFDHIAQCEDVVFALKKLGYKVGLNIMQSNMRTDNELSEAARLIKKWNGADVLYFADSLGSMGGDDVIRIISALRSHWDGDLGFHAHNNKGLAVLNALTAIENGVTWIDATILGMGRGAGNAQTESLLLELEEKYKLNYNASELFDLVLSNFTPLKNRLNWGEGLLYYLAASYDIHPTYIQDILSENRYSNKEALQIVKFLSTLDAQHYDQELLLHAQGDTTNKGSWSAKGWCSDQEVLILGSGGSLSKYQKDIIEYIKIYRPIVLSLNVKGEFPEDLVDVYLSSNESKMMAEYGLYNLLSKPIIVSKLLLQKVVKKPIKIKKLLDYGLNIKHGIFAINETECTLPYELSIGYALALIEMGGAKGISLVGFDGYDRDDIRQIKMVELLNLFQNQSSVPVTALTPTIYNVEQGSIYARKL
jgi:4-hydroxy 2-oxovalerate aldolase